MITRPLIVWVNVSKIFIFFVLIKFRVDKVIQPFDGIKFNFTKVGQEELLFQFEASDDIQFFPDMPLDADNSPSVVAINVKEFKAF